ncbi:hypothetical protein NVP1244A_095 [Vibrio phage 1.244.A._10N.261.54.C3]|nr:hypothetical protein NVP1244A_095 [Vibrio phage 1.244.A._10N.261.54.C3]AUR98723.1 hypothetical protein NVP1255O_095 [Vibrio phage 1.255.O._10N.286.45.F1]
MSNQMDGLAIKILGDGDQKKIIMRALQESAKTLNIEEGVVTFACSDNNNRMQNLEMFVFSRPQHVNELFALNECEYDIGDDVPSDEYEFNLIADVVHADDVVRLQLSSWLFKIIEGAVSIMIIDGK